MKTEVSADELAALLGVGPNEIAERTKSGFFRPVAGRFDLRIAASKFANELREVAAGRQVSRVESDDARGEELDAAAWSAAVREEGALDARLRREILEGKLVERGAVIRHVGGAVTVCRNEIQDACKRLRSQIFNMTPKTRWALDRAARISLDMLAAHEGRVREEKDGG